MRTQLPFAITGKPANGYHLADPLLDGASGGVEWLADVRNGSWPLSWPVPRDGHALPDLSGNDLASTLVGTSYAITDRALDFSAYTASSGYISIPSGMMTQFIADGASRKYLVVIYARLPASADWTTAGADQNFFTIGGGVSGYATDTAVLGHMAAGTGPVLRWSVNDATARRVLSINDTPLTAVGAYGNVCQIAAWMDGTDTRFRIKTATGEHTATFATTTYHASLAADISTIGHNTSTFALSDISGFRVIRAWFENLETSGRTPTTVLDADWTRFIA